MALILSDRVKETTTTTGTGTYTLGGAALGFESFASIGNSNTTYYCCTNGTDFEVGIGTYTSSGTTLARTTILQSSNSDNEVNWSAGTREIFCTLPAEKSVVKDTNDDIILANNEEIKLGTNGALRIRHAGSNSLIEENGGGNLIIKADPVFLLEKSGTSDRMLLANSTGAVELYHNAVKKFETSSTGATLTGKLTTDTIDSGDIRIEDTSPTLLYNDTNESTDNKAFQLTGNGGVLSIQYLNDSLGGGGGYITFPRTDNNLDSLDMYRAGVLKNRLTTTGDNYITSGNVGIGTTSPSTKLEVDGDVKATNVLAEDGYVGAGDISADNWAKFHFISSDPSGFSSQYTNAAVISNEQGTANQHLYLFDTTQDNTNDLFGLSTGVPVFSITGQGHLVFKRPQGNTSYDVTLACPTPTAARTATLPDATGTIITTGNLSSITSTGTLTSLTVTGAINAGTLFANASIGNSQSAKGVYAGLSQGSDPQISLVGDNSNTSCQIDFSHDVSVDYDVRLILEDTGNRLSMKSHGNETIANFNGDGAVEIFHDNVKKFQTNSDGVQILDNGAGSTAVLELGTGSTTESGFIRLHGSTANKSSSIYTSNGNLHIDSASGNYGIYLNWYTSDGGSSTNGTIFGDGNSNQVGRIDGSGNLTITGALSAATKSFDIEHPTKHNMRLKHGSLEGPEHGVYVRGILTDENVIELPDYWTGLVHEDSITAQLTPKGHMQQLYVKEIRDNKVYVENTSATKIDCFYFVQANRKDTEGFEVEYES